MSKQITPPEDVGVIIGRFQAHELHEGHRSLIDKVRASHDRVIVFLGLSVLRGTIADPLDFNSRKVMFQEEYPDIEIYYIEDCRDNAIWAAKLDREIRRWCKPSQTVRLYGSRDSFIWAYEEGKGKFPVTELEPTTFVSSTEIRKRIANNYKPTKDFRAGRIAQAFDRYVGCQPSVDIFPLRRYPSWPEPQRWHDVLLGRKPGEAQWRAIGGFADPKSPSYEADALRELHEEAGSFDTTQPVYIGSAIIDDWRYKKQPDKIKSSVFVVEYLFGRPEAGDDIETVSWFPLQDVLEARIPIVPEHLPLIRMLAQYVANNPPVFVETTSR